MDSPVIGIDIFMSLVPQGKYKVSSSQTKSGPSVLYISQEFPWLRALWHQEGNCIALINNISYKEINLIPTSFKDFSTPARQGQIKNT